MLLSQLEKMMWFLSFNNSTALRLEPETAVVRRGVTVVSTTFT